MLTLVKLPYLNVFGLISFSLHERSCWTLITYFNIFWSKLVCGQSYKQFTSINYDPRVVIWAIF